MALPKEITVVEVGPRDGFQNEPGFIPTEHKIQIIDELSDTGLKRIEATSFVHPKAVPQLADAAEVISMIKRNPGVIYEALIPNLKGMERALESGVKDVELVVSASESHNRKNINMPVKDSLNGFRQVVEMAVKNGVSVTGGIATAFGCAYEGRIPFEKVEYIIDAYLSMGVNEVSMGDTIGAADPVSVKTMVQKAMRMTGEVPLRLHFHNTRGQGLANVLAALQEGVTIYDTSICGLGGVSIFSGSDRQSFHCGSGKHDSQHGHTDRYRFK